MKKLQPVSLKFNNVLLRFYLMIASALVFGFLGYWTIAVIAAYGFGLSAIIGLAYKEEESPKINKETRIKTEQAELVTLEGTSKLRKAG